MELGAIVSNLSQSVVSDPGSFVSQQAVNSSPVPLACWSTAAADVDEVWLEEWRATGWKTGMKTGVGTIQRNTRENDTMRVPIWCADSPAQIQIRNSRTMRK